MRDLEGRQLGENRTHVRKLVSIIILCFEVKNDMPGRSIITMAMMLKKLGHTVHFVVCYNDEPRKSPLLQKFVVHPVFNWLPKCCCTFLRSGFKNLRAAYAAFWIVRNLENLQPAFVITDINSIVLPILRARTIDVVLIKHYADLQTPSTWDNCFPRYARRYRSWTMNAAITILVENISARNYVMRSGNINTPIEVFYPTTNHDIQIETIDDLNNFFPKITDNVTYFLVMGDFKIEDNIELAIKAFNELMKRRPKKDLRLFICGNFCQLDAQRSRYYNKLRYEVACSSCKHNIILLPNAGKNVKKSLIARSAAVLYTTLEPKSYDPLVECFSLGAILICVTSDYTREIVCHKLTGFISDPLPTSFTEWMKTVIDNRRLIGYMRYMVQLDYANRFSRNTYAYHLSELVRRFVKPYTEVSCRFSWRFVSFKQTVNYLQRVFGLLQSHSVFETRGPLTLSELMSTTNRLQPINIWIKKMLEDEDAQQMQLKIEDMRRKLVFQVNYLQTIMEHSGIDDFVRTKIKIQFNYLNKLLPLTAESQVIPVPCELPHRSESVSVSMSVKLREENLQLEDASLLFKEKFYQMEEVIEKYFDDLNKLRRKMRPLNAPIIYKPMIWDDRSLSPGGDFNDDFSDIIFKLEKSKQPLKSSTYQWKYPTVESVSDYGFIDEEFEFKDMPGIPEVKSDLTIDVKSRLMKLENSPPKKCPSDTALFDFDRDFRHHYFS